MGRYSIGVNGALLLDGRPASELGYNAYSLGQKAWLDANYVYRTDIPLLHSLGVRTLRVMCAPFNGNEWDTLIGNPIPANWAAVPATYRSIMEEFFDLCEEYDIAIVACLMWNYKAIPDMLSEAYDVAFASSSSASAVYWKAWATLFVNQFKDHGGLGMWQIGNEWPMLQTTLYGGVAPYSGHDAERVRATVAEIATAIRAADPDTPINSGSIGFPTYLLAYRPAAQYVPDFPLYWAPDPCDVAGVHLYMDNAFVGGEWDGGKWANFDTVKELLASYKMRANAVGKAFILDEFGVNDEQQAGPDTSLFEQFLTGARAAGVECCLVWNWNEDFITVRKWNIYPGSTNAGHPRGDAYIAAVRNSAPMGRQPDWLKGIRPRQSQYAVFSGVTGGEIIIPASNAYNTRTMTLSCWIRGRNAGSFTTAIRYRNAATTNGWILIFDTNGIRPFMDWRKAGPASANNTSGQIADWVPGEWYHMTFAFLNPAGSPFTRTIWVNGFQWLYTTGADAGYVPPDGSVSLSFGSGNGSGYSAIDLADVCLSDRMLTTDEVMALYKTGTAPSTGLVGRWKLDGNANDSISSNNGVAGAGVRYVDV